MSGSYEVISCTSNQPTSYHHKDLEQTIINQIFTLSQILEKTVEYQEGIHHLFMDFKAAYDSINRKMLYSAMEEFGIPLKLIRLVKQTMARVQCLIRVQSYLSNPLEAKNGLRQGDALACLLFNIVLEKLVRDSGIQTRGTIFYKTVQMLAYADDVDLMSRTMIGLRGQGKKNFAGFVPRSGHRRVEMASARAERSFV
jgi:hypothetical protein